MRLFPGSPKSGPSYSAEYLGFFNQLEEALHTAYSDQQEIEEARKSLKLKQVQAGNKRNTFFLLSSTLLRQQLQNDGGMVDVTLSCAASLLSRMKQKSIQKDVAQQKCKSTCDGELSGQLGVIRKLHDDYQAALRLADSLLWEGFSKQESENAFTDLLTEYQEKIQTLYEHETHRLTNLLPKLKDSLQEAIAAPGRHLFAKSFQAMSLALENMQAVFDDELEYMRRGYLDRQFLYQILEGFVGRLLKFRSDYQMYVDIYSHDGVGNISARASSANLPEKLVENYQRLFTITKQIFYNRPGNISQIFTELRNEVTSLYENSVQHSGSFRLSQCGLNVVKKVIHTWCAAEISRMENYFEQANAPLREFATARGLLSLIEAAPTAQQVQSENKAKLSAARKLRLV